MTTTFHDARCCHCCCGPRKKRGEVDVADANPTARYCQTTTMIPTKERRTTKVRLGNAVDGVDGTEDDQTGRIRRENDDCGDGAGGGSGDDSSARQGHHRANGHDATRPQRTMISRDARTRPPP